MKNQMVAFPEKQPNLLTSSSQATAFVFSSTTQKPSSHQQGKLFISRYYEIILYQNQSKVKILIYTLLT